MDLVTFVFLEPMTVHQDTRMMEEKQKCAFYFKKAATQVTKTKELVIYAFLKTVTVKPDIKTMAERLFHAS